MSADARCSPRTPSCQGPWSRTSPYGWARPSEQRPQPVQLEDVPDPGGRNRWVGIPASLSPAHPVPLENRIGR